MDWKVAYFTDVPHARHFTSFTDADYAKKILFGGHSTPDNTYFNDTFEFNLERISFDP